MTRRVATEDEAIDTRISLRGQTFCISPEKNDLKSEE